MAHTKENAWERVYECPALRQKRPIRLRTPPYPLAPGPVTALGREELDLTNEQAVANHLAQNQPNLIVNASAWTALDAAETQHADAHWLNIQLPDWQSQLALTLNE